MKALTKYFKYWHWFAISISVVVIMGVLLLQYINRQYQVSTTVLIQEDKKGESVLNETAFSDLNMFHANRSVDNETQVLLSIDLLQKVFSSLSLNTRYYINGIFKRKELYAVPLPIKVVIKRINHEGYRGFTDINIINAEKFELISPIDGEKRIYRFGEIINTPNYSVQIFRGPAFNTADKNLSISFTDIKAMAMSYNMLGLQITPVVKDANTLLLAVYDNVPQRGMDILNRLIDIYNTENNSSKTQLAKATITFIDNRLKFLNTDLTNVEHNVQEYKQNNSVTNPESDAQANLQKVGEYNQQLQAVMVQLNIVESIESYLKQSSNQFTLVPSTLGLQDGTLLALINKFNDLQQEYQHLLSNNQPNNPLVINMKEQLVSLKQNIQENLRNIKSGMIINRDNLASNLSRFESKIKTVPVIETGLQERDRDQSVKQALLQYLLQKREETELSLLANQPDARIVDSPNYDPNGGKPKPMLVILCAIFLGGIIPIFLIFIKEFLNKKIENVEDLNVFSNVKILGELCHIKKKESLKIANNSRTNMTELFRYIRTNLSFNSNDQYNQVILITSCVQGEGKTFTSINLARSLASINKRTVVMEFDLRKPDLLKNMKLSAKIGITNYINSDDITIEDIIQPTTISPNLFVIGCGTVCKEPGELILSPKIEELFAQLRKQFDYIIVDTSPVGLVADAFSLTPYTDSSIYVIRYNFTQKAHLSILQDIYDNHKFKNLMLVLNDAKSDNLKNYVYGSYAYV